MCMELPGHPRYSEQAGTGLSLLWFWEFSDRSECAHIIYPVLLRENRKQELQSCTFKGVPSKLLGKPQAHSTATDTVSQIHS